jgi:hypothetical protein
MAKVLLPKGSELQMLGLDHPPFGPPPLKDAKQALREGDD